MEANMESVMTVVGHLQGLYPWNSMSSAIADFSSKLRLPFKTQTQDKEKR